MRIVDGVGANGEFKIATPELAPGQYEITLSHDPNFPGGDADLYVRKNVAPSFDDFDCRPFIDGSDESCEITLTVPTRLHLMVHGYAQEWNQFQLSVEQK